MRTENRILWRITAVVTSYCRSVQSPGEGVGTGQPENNKGEDVCESKAGTRVEGRPAGRGGAVWRLLRAGQLLVPGGRVGTGVATLGSGARRLAGNSRDGTQSHIAGKWEGLGGSGRGLEGVGGAWREREWTGGQSPQQQSTRVLQLRITQVTPVRVRRRGTERLETLRKESETRKRNKSVRNTQEGTESKVI